MLVRMKDEWRSALRSRITKICEDDVERPDRFVAFNLTFTDAEERAAEAFDVVNTMPGPWATNSSATTTNSR
jgi:hypothetical protein